MKRIDRNRMEDGFSQSAFPTKVGVLRGGVFTLALYFAAASSSYASDWTGNGANSYWNTAANWNSMPSTSSSLVFRNASPNRTTATLNDLYSYTGNMHMGKGSSAAAPYIFEADAPDHGLTIQDDAWLGYYEDGGLWLRSGTYTFGTKDGKHLHLGQGSGGATHNFWLRVGDGMSTVSLASQQSPVLMYGGSTLVADYATLDFSGLNLEMHNSSSAYLTNTTMTVGYLYLIDTSSAMASNSTLTIDGDLNIANATGNSCAFTGKSTMLNLTKSGCVFNVGFGSNATGVVEKIDGDWSCYYLRLGRNNGSVGTFTMNGGSLTIHTQFQIGVSANSIGTFTLNSGSITAEGSTMIANAGGSTGTLTLNGGTLTAKNITTSGSGKIVFNGGTLIAGAGGTLIAPALTVEVGANGGTIDTARNSITIGPGILSASGANSTFSFTGDGMVAITNAFTCAATSLDAGTALCVTDLNKSLAANLTVVIPADGVGDGTLVLTNTTDNGTFTAADLSAITLAGNGDNRYVLLLADDSTTIRISDTLAGEYVWNDGASEADWTSAGKWSKGGVAGDWYNSTHAAFANSGDKATLSTDVTAVDVTFRADAEVLAGGGTFTVPTVIVSNGVSAAILAPTAGPFAKAGAGTLTLGESRTDTTVLSEGTLAFSGSASLDWTKLTLGTDAEKPVTLRMGANATLANIPATWEIGNTPGITSTIVKEGGDWSVENIYLASGSGATASLYNNGGTLGINGTFDLGRGAAGAHFEIAGGTVTHSGYIHMGATGPGTMTVKPGCTYEITKASGYGIIVGGRTNATLHVEGGDMLLNSPINISYYGDKGTAGAVNITDGGSITCSRIVVNGFTSGGSAAITIDGGTIRASENNAAFIPNKNNLTVTAGANGGTIDVNGKDITIAKSISGAGGMTFKGGGTARLSAAPAYAGKTTVEIGTTVHVAAPGDIASGYELTVPATPPADGVYAVFTIDGAGTFASSVLDGVACPSGGTLRLSTDLKSILCVYGNPGCVWIGGSNGSLSVASNWLNGIVPTSGYSCTIGNPSAANLALGDTFAPSSISFSTNSALITITGERALSGISAIENNSQQHHVFACPVDARAATPPLPLADANYLVFSGGISLLSMPSDENMRLAGVWNLAGDWHEPPSGTSVKSGSTVTVSGTLSEGYNIVIQANATLQVAGVTASNGTANKNRFLYQNDGTFIVDGEIMDTVQSSSTAYGLAGLFANGNNRAVTRVNGLVHNASTPGGHIFRLNNSANSATNTIVLGSGGLSFRENLASAANCYPYFMIDSGKAVILASSADWSFGANSVSGRDLCLELTGDVIIDTSDYDNRATGHTVRAIGRIGNNGSVTVKGCGTLLFEKLSDFAGGLVVQDTATVAVHVGSAPTRSNVTVTNEATLLVAQSGTVSLHRDLTVADGARLGFNFTEKNAIPVLDVSAGDVTFGGQSNVVVKVSAADGVRARSGANTLTYGGKFAGVHVALADGYPDWVKDIGIVDGEIVLDVKQGGLILFVR